MKLFDYQAELVSDVRKSMARNKRVIMQLPTGGGKGVILSEIARLAIEKGRTPCISCHRIEIFQQLWDNLLKFGITPGLISSGQYPQRSACYLSMVETVWRRMNKGMTDHLGIDFFIMDEAHFGSYYKLVNELNCHVLGCTATPKSTGSPELKEYFDDIVLGPPTHELVRIKRLCPVKTYSISHDFSKVKMKGREYDDKSLFKEFKTPKLWNGAVETYLKVAKGLKALCYCVNVEHSNDVMLQFREHGIKAAHVDGKTSDEDRKRIFNMYRHGSIEVICNVGIATTGTDLPDTECIIQNFATTSIVKHIQTLGRGARVSTGKNNFIAIDMGRNYLRHGEFGEFIDWKHIFENPNDSYQKREKRSKRECDECGAVIKFSLRSCPYCNHTISEKQLEDKLFSGATVEEVREYKLKNLPPHLRKPINQLSRSELIEYGKHMGYKPSWAFVILNKRK